MYIGELWYKNRHHFRQVQLGKVPADEFDTIKRLLSQRTHLESLRILMPGQKLSTANLLTLMSQRNCKDGRDRVYGLLGITRDIEMVPDYTLSPGRVFAEFITKVLKSGDFSVLHACCIGTADAALPSYVPALTSKTPHIAIASAYFNRPGRALFKAGLQYKPKVHLDKGIHISIHGTPIDTVVGKLDFAESLTTRHYRPKCIPLDCTLRSQYYTALLYILLNASSQLHWQIKFHLNKPSPRSRNFQSETYPYNTLFNILTHTMTVVAPTNHVSTSFDESEESEYAHYEEWTSHADVPNQVVLNHDSHRSLLQRSLFWTKQGFIGIGTRHVRPGDQAVVFDGDSVAFLLRRKPRRREKTPDVFDVVGDCYVYGWMGEVESSAIPLYTGPPSPGKKSGTASAKDTPREDSEKARKCPVSGREVVPRMFVIQ